MNYYQQGDVILKPVGIFNVFTQEFAEIPKEAKKVKGNLVLKGTNNSHALYGGKFQLYKHNDVLFVRVTKETVLDHVKDHKVKRRVHAEHHAQKIESGDYFLAPLNEFDHQKNESRRVID